MEWKVSALRFLIAPTGEKLPALSRVLLHLATVFFTFAAIPSSTNTCFGRRGRRQLLDTGLFRQLGCRSAVAGMVADVDPL
jgi:hypothetical protein